VTKFVEPVAGGGILSLFARTKTQTQPAAQTQTQTEARAEAMSEDRECGETSCEERSARAGVLATTKASCVPATIGVPATTKASSATIAGTSLTTHAGKNRQDDERRWPRAFLYEPY